jgi:hypothetical protein
MKSEDDAGGETGEPSTGSARPENEKSERCRDDEIERQYVSDRRALHLSRTRKDEEPDDGDGQELEEEKSFSGA